VNLDTVRFEGRGFEYADTEKKDRYRFLIYRKGANNDTSDSVVSSSSRDSDIGHRDDENFPSNNEFEIYCHVRCHKPGNILFPRKYRPIELTATLTIPKRQDVDTGDAENRQIWLEPLLHQMMA